HQILSRHLRGAAHQDHDDADEQPHVSGEKVFDVASETDAGQRWSSARYHSSSVGPKNMTTKSAMPRKTPNGIAACMPRLLRIATMRPMTAPLVEAIIRAGKSARQPTIAPIIASIFTSPRPIPSMRRIRR